MRLLPGLLLVYAGCVLTALPLKLHFAARVQGTDNLAGCWWAAASMTSTTFVIVSTVHLQFLLVPTSASYLLTLHYTVPQGLKALVLSRFTN